MTDDSQQRFLRLFSQASGDLHAFLWCICGNPSDVDELFQELSYRLWTHFDKYDPERPFLPWARGVGRLLVLEHRRKNAKTVQLSDAAIESIIDDYDREASNARDRRSALARCLAKLPKTDQSLVQMRYQKQMRPKAIAESIDRSVHSVYRSLTRIHRALLDCIQLTLAAD